MQRQNSCRCWKFLQYDFPLHFPFSPPTPLSSSCWLFCPLGAQQKFSLQGPPDCPLTHLGGAAELTTYKTPCCRPEGRGTSILLHLVMRKIEMIFRNWNWDFFQKLAKVSKPRSFGTKMSIFDHQYKTDSQFVEERVELICVRICSYDHQNDKAKKFLMVKAYSLPWNDFISKWMQNQLIHSVTSTTIAKLVPAWLVGATCLIVFVFCLSSYWSHSLSISVEKLWQAVVIIIWWIAHCTQFELFAHRNQQLHL